MRRCGQSSSRRSTFHTLPVAKAPVVGAEHAQVHHRVRFDAAGEVDVPLEIAERQRSRRGEHRLPAVQPGIARARHRSPAVRSSIHEDDMVEQVDRLEAEHERRIAVLFEDDGCRERRLETMGGACPDDPAEAAERFTAALGVVGQRVQPVLHRGRRTQTRDEPPFARPCSGSSRRARSVSAREGESL